MQALRTLYVTADGSTVVGEGDPLAHTLLCREGCELDTDYMTRRGIVLPAEPEPVFEVIPYHEEASEAPAAPSEAVADVPAPVVETIEPVVVDAPAEAPAAEAPAEPVTEVAAEAPAV